MARRHSVDVNSGACELARESSSQREYRSFRGHVMKHERISGPDGTGRNINDLSFALCLHMWHDCFATLPNTLDVDLHHTVPLWFGNLVERTHGCAPVECCIIDENVDVPETLDNGACHRLGTLHACYVG